MKIAAIVQARMGSTRLPGKVMKEIEGKPMVWHVVNRLRACKNLDDIILAIPSTAENDVLEKFAKENEVNYYRGSEEDVLSRYYKAAKKFGSDIIVRITSDCPLITPQVVDLVISSHLEKKADYTSNVKKRTFPRGLDTEVFSFEVLEKAAENAGKDYQREHVTAYIHEDSKKFNLNSVEAKRRLHRSDLRLTVDTKEDLTLIRKIFEHLYQEDEIIDTKEVIEFLDNNPEIAQINADVKQKI